MTIEIRAVQGAILGGPDQSPYVELELRQDGRAVLEAGHRPSASESGSAARDGSFGVWTSSLSGGTYVIADLSAMQGVADSLRPHIARVLAGQAAFPHASAPDESSAEIEKILGSARWWDDEQQVWDADEWLYDLGYLGAAKDYGLTIDSDEGAFKAAGRKIEADALRYNVILVNTGALLSRIREALREKEEAYA